MQQEATIPEKDLRQVLTGSEEKVPYIIRLKYFLYSKAGQIELMLVR